MVAVLERDDLSVDKEAEVLHALIVWAEHDQPRRTPALAKLLGLVRWPLLDGAFLADVEDAYPLLSERSRDKKRPKKRPKKRLPKHCQ